MKRFNYEQFVSSMRFYDVSYILYPTQMEYSKFQCLLISQKSTKVKYQGHTILIILQLLQAFDTPQIGHFHLSKTLTKKESN